MGTAASVTTTVSVEYEDLESLNFVQIIPNCTEKTLAIYASRFPNTLDQRVLKFVFSKLNDDAPYSLVYFHAGIHGGFVKISYFGSSPKKKATLILGYFLVKNVVLGCFRVKTCDFRSFWV